MRAREGGLSRVRGRLFFSAVTVAVALFLSGCGTTLLYPPTDPVEPRVVFLIDHGRHSSLAISGDDGRLTRYAYGDWRYYADQDTSVASGVAALLWPTPATLARGELAGPPDVDTLRSQLRVGIEHIYVFEVAGEDADRVMGILDNIHTEGQEDHQYVPAFDMVFAPHPEAYTWRNNSASVVATWMDNLGVDVRGPALLASWRVVNEQTQ